MINIFILRLTLGHFGDGYPWHTKTLEELTARLETLSRSLEKPAKISLRNGFSYKKCLYFVFKINFIEPVKSCFGETSNNADLKPNRKSNRKYHSN